MIVGRRWIGAVAWGLVAATTEAAAQPATQASDGRATALRRRAQWNASLTPDSVPGALVRRVTTDSPAARAGLRVGDRVVTINGVQAGRSEEFWAAIGGVRGGDSVRATVVRGTTRDTQLVRFVVDSVPHERIRGASVAYETVRSDRGYLLRTVITRPEGAGRSRLPAVLFIPWLSCDVVEKPEPGNDGFAHLIRDVAAGSGTMLVRVEKPGLGDSQGPDCRHAGLDHELAAYRAALRALRARADVDTTRVFLLGGSIGGAIAPVLAAETPEMIAGVIAVNGFSRTWYEHMLDIERRRLTLSGQSAPQVNAAMRGFAKFYTGYLLDGHTPGQVLSASPELRPLWYDEPAHQYGRPAAYYQAVQRLDVEAAWATLAARRIPSLIVWGEYDWIMGRAEADRPLEIVTAITPGLAQLVVLPKTGHGLMVFESMAAAFAGERPRYDGEPGRVINEWLSRQASTPSTK